MVVGSVKIQKVQGINSPIKYSACLLFSACVGALVKAGRERERDELTNLTNISR